MRGESGFTLLEVLVALAIGSLAITAWLTLQSDFIARWTGAEQRRAAVQLGESLVDRLGRDLPLKPSEGRDNKPGGLAWRLTVQPLEAPIEIGTSVWRLYAFTLAIGAEASRPILMLQGRRLARVDEKA